MARILIADDDSASYEVMSVALTSEGHEVHYATDGQEALDMVLDVKPDLIFLDVMMPALDGYETCKRLRGNAEVPADLPIVFLTSTEEDRGKIDEAGASDYLPKRHMIADLQDMLVKHLGPKAFPS